MKDARYKEGDLRPIIDGLGPREFLEAIAPGCDSLHIEPFTDDRYCFVTVVNAKGGYYEGTKRPLMRWAITRAAEIAGFSLTGRFIINRHESEPVSFNRYLEPQKAQSFTSNQEVESDLVSKNYVYFIQAAGNGPIKIGHAWCAESRLKAIQPYSPLKLVIIAVIANGGQQLEHQLHVRFARHRLHGEWFKPAKELLDYIREEAEPWDN